MPVAQDLQQFHHQLVRAVSFNNHVELGFSKCPLIKLSLLSIEDRDDLVISCAVCHVNIALQIAHQQAVLLLRGVLSHNQMLIVRMHEIGRKSHKFLLSLIFVDLPGVGVNRHDALDYLLARYADQRAVNKVADASTDDMQLQSYSVQLLQQIDNMRSVDQLRIFEHFDGVIAGDLMFLEQSTLYLIQLLHILELLCELKRGIGFIRSVLAIVIKQLMPEMRGDILIGDPHAEQRVAFLVAEPMLGESMVEVGNQVDFLVLMADLEDLCHQRFEVRERDLLMGVESCDWGWLCQRQLDKFISEHCLFIVESLDF